MLECVMKYNFTTITSHGDMIKMRIPYDIRGFAEGVELYSSYFRQYNPRKKINRYGLSLKTLNGELDEGVDLDSLPEYNKEHGTEYGEKDFNKSTEAHEMLLEACPKLREIDEHIVRSHVLRLGVGGFFPNHRDSVRPNTPTFRLVAPIKNYNVPSTYFVFENEKILNFEPAIYFLNTHKYHALCNASLDDTYWLVLNIMLNDDTISWVIANG